MQSKTVLWLVVSISLFASSAFAAEDAREEEKAKQAFSKGKELFKKEAYGEASEAFREAYALKKSYKIWFNIAQSEAASNQLGLALEAFERYLAEGGDDVTYERRDYVLKELERLRSLVGSLNVVAPDDAVVFVDDRERGRMPLIGLLKVTAGVVHTIRVVKDEESLIERKVKVSGGETLTITVRASELEPKPKEPEAENAEPDAPAQEQPEPGSKLPAWGWSTLGVGAALLIGGGVTGGIALSLNGDIEDNCPNGDCPPAYHDDLDKRDALAITTNVLLATGGALAATGAVLLIVHATKRGENPEPVAFGFTPFGDLGIAIQKRF